MGAIGHRRASIIALLDDKTTEAALDVIREAITAKDQNAARWWIEQRYGRAAQRVELTGEEGGPVNVTIQDCRHAIAEVFGSGAAGDVPVSAPVGAVQAPAAGGEQGAADSLLDNGSVRGNP